VLEALLVMLLTSQVSADPNREVTEHIIVVTAEHVNEAGTHNQYAPKACYDPIPDLLHAQPTIFLPQVKDRPESMINNDNVSISTKKPLGLIIST